MRSSERLQHEIDATLEEVEAFLQDLAYTDISTEYHQRRHKLESKVKLLRAKSHIHLQRMPLSSWRFIYDTFPRDLQKRPRSSTSPDHLFNFLPDVPEEEDEPSLTGTGREQTVAMKGCRKDPMNSDPFEGVTRPRSASFPLSL